MSLEYRLHLPLKYSVLRERWKTEVFKRIQKMICLGSGLVEESHGKLIHWHWSYRTCDKSCDYELHVHLHTHRRSVEQ